MSSPPSIPKEKRGLVSAFLGQPYLLLVLAPTFWGGNFAIAKLAVGEIDPNLLLLGRWIGASAILLVIATNAARKDWPRIRPALHWLAFYGIVGFALFNFLVYKGAHFTTAINSSIEQAAIPVFVLLLNLAVFRVIPRPLQIVGLFLTILGVTWVATQGQPMRLLALDINVGDAMIILACLFYATYSLALRKKPDIDWLSYMLITSLAALVTSVILQMIFGGGWSEFVVHFGEITPIGWLCAIYTMIFPSILAQTFYARGVELVGPNRASIFINLLPISGTILSVLIVGESFQLFHAVAAVLVVTGIFLSEYASRKHDPAKMHNKTTI
jgi:drug/metabolite transporter (DMT)-like permease